MTEVVLVMQTVWLMCGVTEVVLMMQTVWLMYVGDSGGVCAATQRWCG